MTVKTYKAHGYREPYVIIHHRPTKRSVILNRQYEMIEERDWLAGIPLGWEKVNQWDGWKPTIPNQLPEDLRDRPEEEFFAFWVQPKKRTCGFCGQGPQAWNGDCPNRSFHNVGG